MRMEKRERIICEIRQFTTSVALIQTERRWYLLKENRFSILRWDFSIHSFVRRHHRLFEILFSICRWMLLYFVNSKNCILWYGMKKGKTRAHTPPTYILFEEHEKIIYTTTNQFVLFNEFPCDTGNVWQTEINWSFFSFLRHHSNIHACSICARCCLQKAAIQKSR